jgi:hypothetical protein
LTDPLTALTDINLDDLVAAFGWQNLPALSNVLRRIFYAPAHKFALQMLDFDRIIAESSLTKAAQHTLSYFVRDVELFGHENLPKDGPVLYLSNHPGMTDTLCLFAAIARPDLRIFAMDRPFLQSLPAMSRQLLYLSDDPNERIHAVKRAAAHLRNGGAMLTFPAGTIEPDPDVYGGALQALDDWTDSAGVFLRFAPETKIVPVLVRRVLWEKAVKHPLTFLRFNPKDRERLGTSLQLLSNVMFDTRPVTARVQFARPISAAEVGSKDMAAIHAAVLERMRGLIQNPPQEKGVSVL